MRISRESGQRSGPDGSALAHRHGAKPGRELTASSVRPSVAPTFGG
jgi:hypothetical protein